MKALKLLPLALVPVIASCASTKVTGSWKSPVVAEKSYEPGKVLVIGQVPGDLRSELEQQTVIDLSKKGVTAVASHDVLPAASAQADVKRAVHDKNFDSVLVASFKGIKRETTYTSYGMGYGPYGYGPSMGGWDGWYGPAVATTTESAIVEANLFDTRSQGEKVWSATTSTEDPQNPSKDLSKVSHALVKRMDKDGFIAASAPRT
jgi:hypothetical protein